MDRDELISRLQARARKKGSIQQIWWNGELIRISEALWRAAHLEDAEPIQVGRDEVLIPSTLRTMQSG